MKIVKKEVGLQQPINAFKANYSTTPKLVVFLLSKDPASEKYVSMKKSACERVGIDCQVINMVGADFDTVKTVIQSFNNDPSTHGIMIQHPFDIHEAIFQVIAPEKDVDGCTMANYAKLKMEKFGDGCDGFIPATVLGLKTLIKEYVKQPSGQRALVIGRSRIVGDPLAEMLRDHFNMTVINAHSKTSQSDLKHYAEDVALIFSASCKDVLNVVNIGVGTMVFDAGFHVEPTGARSDITGLQNENLNNHLAAYTPVFGSIGPMTIQALIQNVIKAAKQQVK